jgi:hypothetical protein
MILILIIIQFVNYLIHSYLFTKKYLNKKPKKLLRDQPMKKEPAALNTLVARFLAGCKLIVGCGAADYWEEEESVVECCWRSSATSA